MNPLRISLFILVFLCATLGLAVLWSCQDKLILAKAQELSPTPAHYDPLATPVIPENPSQADLGRTVFYYNCMPCHGDRGQGLTDEWRAVWVEDHQNCWGRGCHGGRAQDEGFPLPKYIPVVISSADALQRFVTPEDLYNYLKTTHPPQDPGYLQDDEYSAVTTFLLVENGRLPGNAEFKPTVTEQPEPANNLAREAYSPKYSFIVGIFAGSLFAALVVVVICVLHRRRSTRQG